MRLLLFVRQLVLECECFVFELRQVLCSCLRSQLRVCGRSTFDGDRIYTGLK